MKGRGGTVNKMLKAYIIPSAAKVHHHQNEHHAKTLFRGTNSILIPQQLYCLFPQTIVFYIEQTYYKSIPHARMKWGIKTMVLS